MVAGVTVVRGGNKRHLALLQLQLPRLQRCNARRARHHRLARLRRRLTQQPALATLVGRLHLHPLHVHVRRHLLLRCRLLHTLLPQLHVPFLPRTLLQELVQLTLRIHLLLLPVLLWLQLRQRWLQRLVLALVLDLRLQLSLRLRLLPQGGGSREAWCRSSSKAATILTMAATTHCATTLR